MMSEFIEYYVEYENYTSSLLSHFRNLFHRQILVDTTLMCNSNTLKVHKVVLAASSSYFQNTLKQRNGEVLITLKMNFDVLKAIVEFIYSGKTSFIKIHRGELISAARFLNITGLLELEINYTDPIPEFQTPIVFNQPSHVVQDVSQISLEGDNILLDDMTVSTLENDGEKNKYGMIRIPIEIKGKQSNKTRKRNQMQNELKNCDDSFIREETKTAENLLNKAAKKLRKIESGSIKAIQQLKLVQANKNHK